MKKTIKKIIYGMTIILILAGCGKENAQEILLQESTVEETGEVAEKESEDDSEPEATPVIQVKCDCQCQNQTGAPAGAAAGTAVSGELQTGSQPGTSDGKVNINTADLTQLQTLNGIGEVRAQAIISYREAYGAFQSIEEIKNVSGIKDAVFNKIKDDISVG